MENSNPGMPKPSARECIGSFTAYTDDQSAQVIEIWAHRDAVHYGDLKRISPALLFLKTPDGREVDRLDQGEYRLRDEPKTIYTTNDMHAP